MPLQARIAGLRQKHQDVRARQGVLQMNEEAGLLRASSRQAGSAEFIRRGDRLGAAALRSGQWFRPFFAARRLLDGLIVRKKKNVKCSL